MYTKDLPASYQKTRTFDLKQDKKSILLVNGLSLILLIPLYFLLVALNRLFGVMPEGITFTVTADRILPAVILPVVGVIVLFVLIMVLHELIHALFFRHDSGKEVRFGLAYFGAYVGMPGHYFRKGSYLRACLAPLILISAACIVLMLFLRGNLFFITYTIFALHLACCAGDLYYLFALRRASADAYIEDTGPAIQVYEPQPPSAQEQ